MCVASLIDASATVLLTAKTNLQATLCFPFDMARQSYAMTVRAGLIEASMLRSAKLGRLLSQMESIALGPLARTQ